MRERTVVEEKQRDRAHEPNVPVPVHRARFKPAAAVARGLQRAAGNRAAARALGRRRLARRATLRDPENLVYKDSEPNPTGGSELAYIGKLGKEPAFVRYAVLQKLGAVRDQFLQNPQPQKSDTGRVYRDPEKWFELWLEARPAEELRSWLGPIWRQSDHGVLHETDFADDIARAHRIYEIASGGPQRMPEGFGSRLPVPRGTIYSSAHVPRETILDAVGVPRDTFARYAQVAIEYVDLATAQQTYLAAELADENVLWFEVGAQRSPALYISTVDAPRSSVARFKAMGKTYDERFSGTTQKELSELRDSFNKLARPEPQRNVSGAEIGREPRGPGQAKAMANWNALGAAAFANLFGGKSYDLKQNWEWLHVRAASAGGRTEGGNLVAGRFGANSLMITYERLIKQWAAVVGGRDKVWFHFIPVNARPGFADKIEFWVGARGHPVLGNIDPPLRLISIDVTQGKVVDRLSDQIISRHVDWQARVHAPAEADVMDTDADAMAD